MARETIEMIRCVDFCQQLEVVAVVVVGSLIQANTILSDFYRKQAMKAGSVPSPRRSRNVSSDDETFTLEQLSVTVTTIIFQVGSHRYSDP